MGYRIENLDGDELRKNLHPELGFTREDRALNNRRTAFISKLLNRNGIPTIVAMITPFRKAQQRAREIVEEEGQFVLVYVKAPLEVCEARDPKGMYERARGGKIENFTGINHPFQEPHDAEVLVDTSEQSKEECVEAILEQLEELGILEQSLDDRYEFQITRSEESQIKEDLRDRGYLE
jgi:adenylyl-sulfate kinase